MRLANRVGVLPIKDRSINPAQENAGGEGWLLNQFKPDASSDDYASGYQC